MKSTEIRQKFFDFFESKKHKLVPSAPIVLKNDPTLLFTNAGMNQFKDYFLGTKSTSDVRVADTQKCLRVSGKHNDLEEVGRDSYHHTMFEMLGNWSFGDYFKEEAIAWSWELLIDVYGIDKENVYVTVFGGDKEDKLEADEEAVDIWKKYCAEDKILYFDKKDNFWEMGDTGPCGPCSEIHIDLRDDDEKAKIPGAELVNQDHPLVIEIWNLVFIQYNRKASGQLEDLPAKHVDTGMGFERLSMVLQGKKSNYETDIFTGMIQQIEKITHKKYTNNYVDDHKVDIAFRVIVDHIRAVGFTIADGELPSNTGAGYVIRRILRRAVRYYYSFLDRKTPLLHELLPNLANYFADTFPELKAQEAFVSKIILEEEKSFLRTLESGLKRFDEITKSSDVISGQKAFELYDTYGFPIDLTMLIAEERNITVNEADFTSALNEQKARGRKDAERETGDWHILSSDTEVDFVGYDHSEMNNSKILRYREVTKKKKKEYQLVLNKTAFYAEGGGQVGDSGTLQNESETIRVLDTQKENDLVIHIVDKIPTDVKADFTGKINTSKRNLIENNHSATHLLHAALRDVLGDHVHQKGSLVRDKSLRFDFAHFSKMSEEEIAKVEQIVNRKIRENIPLVENRTIGIEEAKKAGAMMLFGEKYGDQVRMITFDQKYSVELCGGCHVQATGEIGYFKIISEAGIAAGVRRIEALTADQAEAHINESFTTLNNVKNLFKNPKNIEAQIAALQEENKQLNKTLDQLKLKEATAQQKDILASKYTLGEVEIIAKEVHNMDAKIAKTVAFNIQNELSNGLICLAINDGKKVQLMLKFDDKMVEKHKLHAGNMVRDLSKLIQGGGGGQANFATAGGSNPAGINEALASFKDMIQNAIS